MPEEWAKALEPTMALLGWVLMPVIELTSRLARVSSRVTTSVWASSSSPCMRIAMTTSSMAVLPARSPRPLTVHSTWVAPAATLDSASAVAMPRSLWVWTEIVTSSMPSTRSRRSLMRLAKSHGME